MKKIILISIFFLIGSLLFSIKLSPSREVMNDFDLISLGETLEIIEKNLSKYDPKYNRLVKVVEGYYEKSISKELELGLAVKKNQDLYDQDFFLVSRPETLQLSLTQVNDYSLSRFFPIKKWNPLIRNLRLSFFNTLLFEKKCSLLFPKVSQALVVLEVLKKRYGLAKIEESEIHYRGINRFIWITKNAKIEYQFYPSKNQFLQKIGYVGWIKITDLERVKKAEMYIRKVKTKIRKLSSK